MKILDDEINNIQPAIVEGLPIEFLSTKSGDNINVVLSNNSGTEWKGKVIVRQDNRKFGSCRELLTGQKHYSKHYNSEVFVSVPAYELRVLSWSLMTNNDIH
jgi:hypothetical protein